MGIRDVLNSLRRQVPPAETIDNLADDVAGEYGFGPQALNVQYRKRPLPPTDNAGQWAYQTYLSPVYTPIGGGIPNQREISTIQQPAVSKQGMLVVPVTGPGILAGQFVSAPLTNVDAPDSNQPIPGYQSFALSPL
jgi:hypothetical protein